MPFITTLSLLSALKAALEALPHPDAAKALAGEKLFERVEFHENKNLREALNDMVIVKQRVCVIVPAGEGYENLKEGRSIRSIRTSSLDILIADRAWTKGGHEAVFGGENNIGVLSMKDQVVNALVANNQLGLAYVSLVPTGGAQIEVVDEKVKDTAGRECYVLSYETPAGEATITPNRQWPFPTA
jgi:hypothetical protein